MSRTRRRLKIVGMVCVAGIAAAACSPAKMGAAAMVGDQRVTVDQLEKAVGNWQQAYNADPLPSNQMRLLDNSQIPRSVLYNLVLFKVADEAAERQGVRVSEGEVDQAITASGGERRLRQAAVTLGVPPQKGRDYVRFQLDLQKIAGSLGSQPTNVQQQQQLQAKLSKVIVTTARSVKIDVNPRYGTFDYKQLGIVAGKDRLSKPETPQLPIRD